MNEASLIGSALVAALSLAALAIAVAWPVAHARPARPEIGALSASYTCVHRPA